jgi:hypothetical protein
MKFTLIIFSDFIGDLHAVVPDTNWLVSAKGKSFADLEREFSSWAEAHNKAPDPECAKTKRSALNWFEYDFLPGYDDLAVFEEWKRCVNSLRIHKDSSRVALSISSESLRLLDGYMLRHNIKTRTKAVERIIKRICNE